tara:strand:- start:118 stop:444 length:327 start_codon:yes stop_codon:yes gene_type:complete
MQTRYRSARTSLLIFDIITWISVIILTLIAFRLFLTGTAIPAILLGVGIWLFAVFEFAFTQFARAQIDIADNTRQILEMMISKQSGPGQVAGKVSTISGQRREPTISK